MTEMIIRQADASDTDAIHGIESICFDDPWSRESIYEEFTKNPRAFYMAAEIEGEVVGYAGLWMIGDEGHITNVAVRPDWRGRSIGGNLVEALLEHTRRQGILHHTLEVRAGNFPAQALYEKYGFKVEGIRRGYYQAGHEDALIMWRHAGDVGTGPSAAKERSKHER